MIACAKSTHVSVTSHSFIAHRRVLRVVPSALPPGISLPSRAVADAEAETDPDPDADTDDDAGDVVGEVRTTKAAWDRK